jgi:uroporphyrinogen-III decarboxylase
MPGMKSLEPCEGWHLLDPQQKRQWRLDRWRQSAQHVAFVGPEAEAAYKAKLERTIAVFNVEEPDRVPVSASAGMLPMAMAGMDYYASIYQPEKAVEASLAFNRQYAEELDTVTPSMFFTVPARALDILDNRLYAYPGHGMPLDGKGFQYVEGEYMMEDEYDAFLLDPSDFWLRTYLPRVYGVFEPLPRMDTLTDITEIFTMQLPALARPDVQAMLQRLLDAGKELASYLATKGPEMEYLAASGHASMPPGGFAKAPFDTLGDTLRGTKGILTDMHRQPDKLLQALDVVADLTITSLLGSPMVADGILVGFPLHKGADGWMSQEQFLSFYWPPLRKVINALVEEGLLVSLFAEGSYNTRLDLVNEFPKGAVHWLFDRTDMGSAKHKLGNNCSIAGNVPSSILVMGTVEEVTAASRKLIETCAPGGGYTLAPGAIPEFPRLENIRAMARTAREYGVYGGV